MPTITFQSDSISVRDLYYDHVDGFPRVLGGACAFCLGDPTGEQRPTHPRIAMFYARNPDAETCPMCKGEA